MMLLSDEHTCLITTSYHVPKLRYDTNKLHCGKLRTILKSCHDLDLDQTMPKVELDQAIFIHCVTEEQ